MKLIVCKVSPEIQLMSLIFFDDPVKLREKYIEHLIVYQ